MAEYEYAELDEATQAARVASFLGSLEATHFDLKLRRDGGDDSLDEQIADLEARASNIKTKYSKILASRQGSAPATTAPQPPGGNP